MGYSAGTWTAGFRGRSMVILTQCAKPVLTGMLCMVMAVAILTLSGATARTAHAAEAGASDAYEQARPDKGGPPFDPPGPPPFVAKPGQAVLSLKHVQGNMQTPGEFTLDVEVNRNKTPVGSYLFEVHYSGWLSLVGVEDVDFGGSPVLGDEEGDAAYRSRVVGDENLDNLLGKLTLNRLSFVVNASSSDRTEIWLEGVEDLAPLLDTEGHEIATHVDSRFKFPMPRWSRDPAKVGDVMGTGRANNIDAIALANFNLGNINALPALENADVRADDVLDFLDAIVLFNWTIGNVAEIPLLPSE